MKRSHVSILVVAVLWGLAAAGAAPAQEGAHHSTGEVDTPDVRPAVLCQETYALCITAQCEEVETDGGRRMAECRCDVIENTADSPAWSIGPGSCDDRAPVEKDGRTVLVSTYSNLYNTGDNQVASCDSIDWAWCYGAPCVVDPDDPATAICNCPIETSETDILGPCEEDLCANGLWSAATAEESCFANCHYYELMKEHGGTNPPATTCSGDPVCDCSTPSGE